MSELNQAMINSLNILKGEKTLEELIIGDEGFFVFNPEEPVSLSTLQDMLHYFSSIEDYEKCLEVKKLLNDGKTIGSDFRKK